MNLCQKPRVTTKNSQLLDKFFSGPLNRDNIDKKWQKSPILNEKIGLKTIFGHFLGHVWTGISMSINFPPTLITYYTFLGQKCSIDFSPDFSHFFTDRSTSKSYTDPLKVISEGSMVEYLSVGSQGAPKIIIGKKIFQVPKNPKIPKSLNPLSQPSVHWTVLGLDMLFHLLCHAYFPI